MINIDFDTNACNDEQKTKIKQLFFEKNLYSGAELSEAINQVSDEYGLTARVIFFKGDISIRIS